MTPSQPKRYWSFTEAVAWIAFRDLNAVRAASRCDRLVREKKASDALTLLVAMAATGARGIAAPATDSESAVPGRSVLLNKSGFDAPPGVLVQSAVKGFEDGIATGRFLKNAAGEVRVDQVKTTYPSVEGRGKGQKKRPSLGYGKVARLGFYFLGTPAPAGKVKPPLLKWCQENGIVSHWRDLATISDQALLWARRELLIRQRHGLGVASAVTPMTSTDLSRHAANLDSWRVVWPTVHTFGDDPA